MEPRIDKHILLLTLGQSATERREVKMYSCSTSKQDGGIVYDS